MENTDRKVPVIMEERRSGVAGRITCLLAGGVVLLAVAFIVLITCGTYVIQQQSDCEEAATAVAPRKENTKEYDYETKANGTVFKEHIIVYEETRREITVNRDSKTGYVASVVFVDYNKDKSVVYDAKSHSCLLCMDAFGDFDAVLTQTPRESDSELRYEVGAPVTDLSELPDEMAPFCSTTNSFWLHESENKPEHPQKRAWFCCECRYYYSNGFVLVITWCQWGGCTGLCFD